MNKVTEEACNGIKQFVTHMRVFECVAYAHVPDQLRKKLDSKGEKCIFFGYSDESKAYKLYNPLTKKVIINIDVQFIEEEEWDGSLEKTINVKTCMSHEDKEELTTTINSSKMTPPPPTQAQQSSQHVTPQKNYRTMLCNQVSATPSKPQRSTTSSTSSTTPRPSSTSINRPKFRI